MNRRGFLQSFSAAGITPLLPPIPVSVLAAPARASTSAGLWAAIYAKSGNTTKFINVARNMGLSNSAIQRVSARAVGVKITAAALSNSMTRLAPSPTFLSTDPLSAPKDLIQNVDRLASLGSDDRATPLLSGSPRQAPDDADLLTRDPVAEVQDSDERPKQQQ